MILKAFAKLKIMDNSEEMNLENDIQVNGLSIPVRGFDRNIPFRFADDSRVVPGDKIFGVLDSDSGIIIYSKQSKNLNKHSKDINSYIDLTWDIDNSLTERFTARIMIDCKNQVGALAKISRAIGLSNANIENLKLVSRSSDFYKLDIDLGVYNLSHLNLMISSVRKLPVVHRVVRVMD
jgi:(p)ppGpp synthase/HD superfamily hydrolase